MSGCGLIKSKIFMGGGVNTDNLFCVDILCHGVPSPLLWKRYLDYISNKYRGTIEAAEFRDKEKFGWHSHFETFKIGDQQISSNDFGTIFINDSFLRPACYNCLYKTVMHPGDITLGDFWRVEKAIHDFDDNKGISLVLINSEKGKMLYDCVRDQLESYEVSLENSAQRIFYEPVDRPKNRDSMWTIFGRKGIGSVIRYYRYRHIVRKLLRKG